MPRWILAAAFVFCVAAQAGTASAQPRQRPATPGRSAKAALEEDAEDLAKRARAERFKVPEGDDVAKLVEFLERLDLYEPESADDLITHADEIQAASRLACRKILKLEKDKKSDAALFARRKLVTFELDRLFSSDNKSEQARIIETAKAYFDDCPKSLADAELALTLGNAVEELRSREEGVEVYKALGTLFSKSDDEDVLGASLRMRGAARRLDSIGEALTLTGETYEGKEFDLKALQGKVVLVDYWTTWCEPCEIESHNIRRQYDIFHERGFEVVGVCCDESRPALNQYMKKTAIPWTTIHHREDGQAHPSLTEYGISAFPTSFLIGRDGKVAALNVRGRGLRRQLVKLLGPLEPLDVTDPTIDSLELTDRISDGGEALAADDKAWTLEELREQLDRKTCTVKLPEPNAEPLAEKDSYKYLRDRVFIVGAVYEPENESDGNVGVATAFAVTADGVLATSAHVFDDDEAVQAMVVMDARGQVWPIEEILASNRETDVCLIRIKAENLKTIPLGRAPEPGTSIRMMGHPGDTFYFLSTGNIANYHVDESRTEWMHVTCDFGQGASGGPAIDEHGNAVGMVTYTSAVFHDDASDLLDEARRFPGTARRGGLTRKRLTAEKGQNPLSPFLIDITAPREPQMVFKACTLSKNLRKLTEK